eukprot:3121927-Prorocentrum_lima.AAC.1
MNTIGGRLVLRASRVLIASSACFFLWGFRLVACSTQLCAIGSEEREGRHHRAVPLDGTGFEPRDL